MLVASHAETREAARIVSSSLLWRTPTRSSLAGQASGSVLQRRDDDKSKTLLVSEQATVEEIELTLNCVASACEYSSPIIRNQILDREVEGTTELTRLFRRMDGIQAKWLVRLILKDIRPAIVPERAVLWKFHFLLPYCLMVRHSLAHALRLVEGFSVHGITPCPDVRG